MKNEPQKTFRIKPKLKTDFDKIFNLIREDQKMIKNFDELDLIEKTYKNFIHRILEIDFFINPAVESFFLNVKEQIEKITTAKGKISSEQFARILLRELEVFKENYKTSKEIIASFVYNQNFTQEQFADPEISIYQREIDKKHLSYIHDNVFETIMKISRFLTIVKKNAKIAIIIEGNILYYLQAFTYGTIEKDVQEILTHYNSVIETPSIYN